MPPKKRCWCAPTRLCARGGSSRTPIWVRCSTRRQATAQRLKAWRGQDTVGDIEIVAATARPSGVIDDLLQLEPATHPLHRGERRLYLLNERVQVGIRLPEPANAGSTLLYLSGSPAHFEALRTHA